VPESKGRAKPAYTPPPKRSSKKNLTNPPWFVPVMLGLMVLGLLWVVTFYVMETKYPIPNIGNMNLVIGFGLMITGFLMTTRWR
jgi:hypothetical protein